MKTTIIAITMLLFSNALFAQQLVLNTKTEYYQKLNKTSEHKEQRTLKAFYNGLNHNSEGVVEASIYNLVMMRLEMPSNDYSKHIEKMKALVADGKTERIQMKAFIGHTYMENPYLFQNVKGLFLKDNLDADDHDKFFRELSDAMQAEYLNVRVGRE